jgi:hypothetical protein
MQYRKEPSWWHRIRLGRLARSSGHVPLADA